MSEVTRYTLPADDERTELQMGVIKALQAVPMHFKSTINIEGLSATDLFAAGGYTLHSRRCHRQASRRHPHIEKNHVYAECQDAFRQPRIHDAERHWL